MSFKNKGAVSVIGVLLFVTCTLAQTRDTLTITGTVKDSSGAAVAGAVVTVNGGLIGSGARDTTDASGAYSITYVPGFFTPPTIMVTATQDTRMGSVTVTVPAGASGRIPLTANIIIGRFINGVTRGLAPKSALSGTSSPLFSFSIDGRRIVMSFTGARANGIRIFAGQPGIFFITGTP